MAERLPSPRRPNARQRDSTYQTGQRCSDKRDHLYVHKWLVLPVLVVLLAVTSVSAGGPPFEPNSEPGLDRARQAANENARGLLVNPLVVGVGVGRTAAGQPAVVVLTESAAASVPRTLDGVPVVVLVTGKIFALHHFCGHDGGPPNSDPFPCGPEVAGITVSPTSGLETTEAGGTAEFSVVLDTQPSADVTIGLSSDDTTEGTVSPISLTFTDTTWDTPQTVTATGVDDALEDTDVVYNILTAAAVSADGDYSGLDASDVEVTNLDDDGAPPVGVDCSATGQTTVRCLHPVPIGVSTGHPAITAGTIGARVTDGVTVFALSNNHVYADENTASVGDAVIQPGTYDGGSSPADDIGTLFDWGTIQFNNTGTCDPAGDTSTCNIFDAAIALSTTGDLGNSTVDAGYGTPKAVTAAASVGLKVQKCGRTTQCTGSRVYATNVTVDVGYDSGVARFIDQIMVVSGGFSAGGDSGSLVVTKGGQGGGRNPVGLLFAGGVNATFINPIDPILIEFGVTVDGP